MSENPQLDLLLRDQQRDEATAKRLPMTVFKTTWAATGVLLGHPLIAMLPFAPAAMRWHNAKLAKHERRSQDQVPVHPLKFLFGIGLACVITVAVVLVGAFVAGAIAFLLGY